MKKRICVLLVGLWASLTFLSCGGSSKKPTVSGLPQRVLAAQGVSSTLTFGGLVILNGQNDTIPRLSPLTAGSSPGLMAISPTRNLAVAFDSVGKTVYAIDTVKESNAGSVRVQGNVTNMVVPSASPVAFATVPTATVTGYNFTGAVDMVTFSTAGLTTIAVPNAQNVVTNSNGTQLLVFSNDSDSITVLTPFSAVPPVDTSCVTNPPNSVCTIVAEPQGSRPVYAIVSGSIAYIFNCGYECGGTDSSGNPVAANIAVFDLGSLTITSTLNVNGATYGVLNGSTLYVAGRGTPTGPTCASLTSSINAKTAATYCGTLDIVNLSTMTDPYYNSPSTEIAIPDGYHDQMDLSFNGKLFVGSHGCQDVGDVNNPTGEVRGCLAIYNTVTNAVVIPPDNGDVNAFQGFTTRYVEYVAEGGNLRVYDTTKNILLINDFLPEGTINVSGYIGGIKAIDFF